MGPRDVFMGLFKLLKSKGILTEVEFKDLDDSMHGITPTEFLNVIDRICKEESK